jgi:hypothetical protein
MNGGNYEQGDFIKLLTNSGDSLNPSKCLAPVIKITTILLERYKIIEDGISKSKTGNERLRKPDH